MKHDLEKRKKLAELQDEYVKLFGKIDYCNVFLETDDEIKTLEQCLVRKVRWKDVTGFDEEAMFEDGDAYM